MYCNFNYYVIQFTVLTGREKTDVTVGWKLQADTGTVMGEREREI
jgi:hypothetical protein